ncbi:MAG: hypothetical protein HY518_05305, partial [Candidatus Aenigmarchaeota archaeon]|nr:hypothetical protein [Candidatus Aenigmarchaeota archaeon]
MTEQKGSATEKVAAGLLVLALAVVAFNSLQLGQLKGDVTRMAVTGAVSAVPESPDVVASLSGVVPSGVPAIYGPELGISFDDISPSDPAKADLTIRKLALLDQQISLSGPELERYIGIASQISCE